MQAAADAGAPLEVRLAALLHDLGKPEAERDGGDHAALGAAAAGRVLRRLRYPTRLREYVVRLVREHPFTLEDEPAPVDARRFLARHGERLARDLLAHRAADLAGKTVPASEWERLERFRALVEQERDAAAPARRPGGGRLRPDRGRLQRGAGARTGAADAARRGRRGARRGTGATTCSAARRSWRDPLGSARLRRRLLDAGGRRQRGAVRVAQPRPDDRRRRRARRREQAAALRRDRSGRRAARAQPAGALDARPPGGAGRARRAGRRPLDGRAAGSRSSR